MRAPAPARRRAASAEDAADTVLAAALELLIREEQKELANSSETLVRTRASAERSARARPDTSCGSSQLRSASMKISFPASVTETYAGDIAVAAKVALLLEGGPFGFPRQEVARLVVRCLGGDEPLATRIVTESTQ